VKVSEKILCEKECAILGINFVEIVMPGWVGSGGAIEFSEYFREDIPRAVQEHGKDTAFFAYSPNPLISCFCQVKK